jgi:hypothetical protein
MRENVDGRRSEKKESELRKLRKNCARQSEKCAV